MNNPKKNDPKPTYLNKVILMLSKLFDILLDMSINISKKISSKLSNLTDEQKVVLKRVVYGILAAIMAIIVITVGNILFIAAIIVFATIMMSEWINIGTTNKYVAKNVWLLYGIIYITVPLTSAIGIRLMMPDGLTIIFLCILTVWTVDTSSYFIGKFVGGIRVIPKISPNKTLSGFIGGTISGMLVCSIIISGIVGYIEIKYLILSLSITVLAQLGDVLESFIKRQCNVKDSGNIIPGHGGLLDRLDSLMLVTPFMFLYTILNGGHL